ncbi:MAG: hypothetical protein ACNYPH_05720 [Gammaproteobacteria bacterium WSBS_2016_MAG_OTU1]
MTSKEKAEKGLGLLKDAIVEIVSQNPGISSTDIFCKLGIQSADAKGRNKNMVPHFILKCCEGTWNGEKGHTFQSLYCDGMLKSKKPGKSRCWYIEN